jgi:hypothetical protein
MTDYIRLGFDLKETPGNNWAVIEINGRNSGIDGLAQLIGQKALESTKKESYRKAFEGSEFPPRGNDDYFHLFYGRDREVSQFKESDLIYCNVESNKATLRERMSREWKASGIESKKPTLELINKHLQLWRGASPNNEALYRKAEEEMLTVASNKALEYKVFYLIHFLWGIDRFGYDPDIGLIFESMGALDRSSTCAPYDLSTFGDFLISLYGEIPVPNGQKLLVVDRDELDGTLWVHPDHMLVAHDDVVTSYSDGLLAVQYVKKNKALEDMTDDKIGQKEIIPKKYLAPYTIWDGSMETVHNFIKKLREESNPLIDVTKYPYIVIKGRSGAHGNEVHIVRMNDETAIQGFLSKIKAGEALIEGFIPSKRLLNYDTYEDHDGCLRLVVEMILDDSRKKITSLFEAGYWRLAPAPLNAHMEQAEESLKANLTGKTPAIPRMASIRELNDASRVVREVVENILRKQF